MVKELINFKKILSLNTSIELSGEVNLINFKEYNEIEDWSKALETIVRSNMVYLKVNDYVEEKLFFINEIEKINIYNNNVSFTYRSKAYTLERTLEYQKAFTSLIFLSNLFKSYNGGLRNG